MRKKLLSLVLAAAMTMSLFVVGAGATSFKDDKDIVNKDAVEKMISLNIINGRDNGEFDPTGIVTRAEMCKMICIALNGGNDPKLSGNVLNASFTDTKGHWAAGYIEYCVNQGIVAGMGNKTFAPDQGVTPTQAAKMLLVALGYDADFEKFVGLTWAINTNKIAMQKDLYDEIQGIDANVGMTRDNAAQMVNNFCDATMVKYEFGFTGSGSSVSGVKQAVDIVKSEQGTDVPQTILKKYYKLVTVNGKMTRIGYDQTKKEYSYDLKNDKGELLGSFKSTTDYSDFFAMKVELLYKDKNNDGKYNSSDDSIYDINNDDSAIIAKGNADDFDKLDNTKSTYTLKFADVTYDLDYANLSKIAVTTAYNADALKLGMNGTDGQIQKTDGSALASPYTVKLIDNDNNGKIDTIVVIPFQVAKVTYVGASNTTFTPQGKKAGTIGNKENKDFNGYTGMVKDDIVAYYQKANTPTDKDTVVKLDVLTGKITGTKTDKVLIDGNWYNTKFLSTKLDNNDTVNYVAVGGDLYYAKVTENGATSKDVVTVYTLATTGDTFGNITGMKVIFADGTKKDVNISKMDGSEVKDLKNDAKKPAVGQMYTYKIDKDGKYELTTLSNGNNKAGHDEYKNDGTLGYADKKVNGYELSDTAVVMVVYGTNPNFEAKTYTGKEFKNSYGAGTFTATSSAVLIDKIDGFNYATIAVLYASTEPTINSGSNYGYLTADAYTSYENGDTYRNFTMWTKSGELKAKEKTTDSISGYTKGVIVTYDTDGKDLVKNVSIPAAITDAVTGWDNVDKIQLKTLGNSKVDSRDTTVLYINSADKKGVENGTISLADDVNDDGNYTNNVRYIGNSTQLDLLVVDVNNKMEAVPNASIEVKLAQADTKAELDLLFSAYTDVSVSGTYTPAEDIVIPVNRTLTVGALDNSTANKTITMETVSGKTAGVLNVNGDIKMGTGNVTVNDFTGDIATNGTGMLTINGTAAKVTATKFIAQTGTNITLGDKAHLTINGDSAATAAQLNAMGKTAGAQVTLKNASTDNVATANSWFNGVNPSVLGKAATNAPTNDNGTASVAINAAVITAGTYKYGTFGFDATTLTAPNVTGWFVQK